MHNVSAQGLLEGVLNSKALVTHTPALPTPPAHATSHPATLRSLQARCTYALHARTPAHAHARQTNTQARIWMTGLRTVDGGTVVGSRLGASVGAAVGLRLGDPDGCSVGESDGCSEL